MMAKAQPGRFITLEGGEGAGKSTQIVSLARRLEDSGIGVISTREPGGAPGADTIRSILVSGDVDRWDPMSEALLNFAARREHLHTRKCRVDLGGGDHSVARMCGRSGGGIDRPRDDPIKRKCDQREKQRAGEKSAVGFRHGADATTARWRHLARGHPPSNLNLLLFLPGVSGIRSGRC